MALLPYQAYDFPTQKSSDEKRERNYGALKKLIPEVTDAASSSNDITNGLRYAMSAKKQLHPNEEDYIRVRVMSSVLDDPGVQYYISVTESFANIYNDYASRVDYSVDRIMIRCRGSEIQPHQTPVELFMHDGAILICYGREPNMNVDTRYKMFVIQEAHDSPRQVTYKVKLSVSMDRIYRIWANHVDADHANVLLFCRCRLKLRVGVIRQSGIRNGDRLFSVLMEL